MKRQKQGDKHAPTYPDLQGFLRQKRRLMGLGLGLVVVAAPGCPKGFLFHGEDTGWGGLAGDVAETGYNWQSVEVRLPIEGTAHLEFVEPWGWIDFHVVAVVQGDELADAVNENSADLLAALETKMAEHRVFNFKPGQDLSSIEAELLAALDTACQELLGAQAGQVLSVLLMVEAYTDENDIDGDIGAVR